MCLIAKDRIPYIIVVRNMYLIEQNYIFKLCRISNQCSLPDNSIAADKCSVPYLRVFADDRRPVNICRWEYFCRF